MKGTNNRKVHQASLLALEILALSVSLIGTMTSRM